METIKKKINDNKQKEKNISNKNSNQITKGNTTISGKNNIDENFHQIGSSEENVNKI